MGSRVTVEYLGTSSVQTKAKVEEIKYSGTGSLGSRRIVDEFESHLSEANAKCERNQQKCGRTESVPFGHSVPYGRTVPE